MAQHVPDGLEVRASPVHGLGVFTTRPFAARARLGDFEGERMSSKTFRERYGSNTRYCYHSARTHEYIVAKETRNFITYLNAVNPGMVPNVELRGWGAHTTCDVAAGVELLLPADAYDYDWDTGERKKRATVTRYIGGT